MIDAKELEDSIIKRGFIDRKVHEITSKYFGDELFINFCINATTMGDSYNFYGCYQIEMQHVWEYNRKDLLRNYSYPQLAFFAQDINVSEIKNEGGRFYQFDLDLFPLNVRVVCKGFQVKDVNEKILIDAKLNEKQ